MDFSKMTEFFEKTADNSIKLDEFWVFNVFLFLSCLNFISIKFFWFLPNFWKFDGFTTFRILKGAEFWNAGLTSPSTWLVYIYIIFILHLGVFTIQSTLDPNHRTTLRPRRTRNQFHFRNLSSSRSHIKNQSPNNCNPKPLERNLPHPAIQQPPHAAPPPPPRGSPPPPSVPSTAVTHRGRPLRHHPERILPHPVIWPLPHRGAPPPRPIPSATVTCRCRPLRRHPERILPHLVIRSPPRAAPPPPLWPTKVTHPGWAPTPPRGSLNNGLGHRIYGFQKGMML
jgi:hypothetical protein